MHLIGIRRLYFVVIYLRGTFWMYMNFSAILMGGFHFCGMYLSFIFSSGNCLGGIYVSDT